MESVLANRDGYALLEGGGEALALGDKGMFHHGEFIEIQGKWL